MDKNIAIFGGTFDPIHNGHLYVIRFLLEALKFNHVMLIPNNISPHKTAPTIPEQRLAMINLALEQVNVDQRIAINTSEISRAGKSYTIDTIMELKKNPLYQDKTFWLVLGLDAFYSLPTWHNWAALQQNVNFIVIDRNLYQDTPAAPPAWVKPYLQDKQIFQIPDDDLTQAPNGLVLMPEIEPLDVSATQIRRLLAPLYLKDAQSVETAELQSELSELLPSQVVAYAVENQLYRHL